VYDFDAMATEAISYRLLAICNALELDHASKEEITTLINRDNTKYYLQIKYRNSNFTADIIRIFSFNYKE
jgi:hypothetical protein